MNAPLDAEDAIRRVETADEIDMRQRLGPMFCLCSLFQLAGAGLFGYLWLSSAQWVKEGDDTGATTGLSTPLPTQPTPLPAPNAWSIWYHYEGTLVIALKTLTAFMTCIMYMLHQDEHAVKEDYYRQANRQQEADAELAQEAGCTPLLKCAQASSNSIACIAQCGLHVWCCIGLLMFMGAGILGRVKEGYTDDSKWYLIIMLSSCAWDFFVVIPALCCCGGIQLLPKFVEIFQREQANQAAAAATARE